MKVAASAVRFSVVWEFRVCAFLLQDLASVCCLVSNSLTSLADALNTRLLLVDPKTTAHH